MASSGFPERKASGSGGMTSPSGSQLDGPPPAPMLPPDGGTLQPGMPAGQGMPMPSFADMAKPMTAGSPGQVTSPEVVMGIYQSIQTIFGMLDSMASIVPDLATDFALQKDLLKQTAAKLVTNSGVSPSPSSTGTNFPGGGFGMGAQ